MSLIAWKGASLDLRYLSWYLHTYDDLLTANMTCDIVSRCHCTIGNLHERRSNAWLRTWHLVKITWDDRMRGVKMRMLCTVVVRRLVSRLMSLILWIGLFLQIRLASQDDNQLGQIGRFYLLILRVGGRCEQRWVCYPGQGFEPTANACFFIVHSFHIVSSYL